MIMLQFSATLYSATARLAPRSWRFTALVTSNLSTATANEHPDASVKEDDSIKFTKTQKKEEQQRSEETNFQMKLDLFEKKSSNENDKFVKQLQAAKSVNDLLNLAFLPNLSIYNALKLMSSITNQINSGKSQMSNIEADKRFIHLRKIIKTNNLEDIDTEKSINLSQYSQLSTPAMIAVITSLREQGKRHAPLLRMLSHNIVKHNIRLNIKQCASLLYGMSVLNFLDKVLLEKIASDLLKSIPNNINTVTNRSIITSLGFLHYKNEDVLDAFCDTLFDDKIDYKFPDYFSILQTFAILQYKTEKSYSFIKNFMEQVTSVSMTPVEWLDVVWSLAVLDIVEPLHVEYILAPAFILKLEDSSKLNTSKKLKLLNMNAVAQFILKDYRGPLLSNDSEVFKDVSLVRTKGKQIYIEALSETLKKLFPSTSYFRTDIDTNMGFLLDAEYCIDNQQKPIPVEDWNKTKNIQRVAIMVHDYHDYCRGQNDLLGLAYLHTQLLKAKGYHVITISYENFSIQDKIEKRIDYLKRSMKIVQQKKSI